MTNPWRSNIRSCPRDFRSFCPAREFGWFSVCLVCVRCVSGVCSVCVRCVFGVCPACVRCLSGVCSVSVRRVFGVCSVSVLLCAICVFFLSCLLWFFIKRGGHCNGGTLNGAKVSPCRCFATAPARRTRAGLRCTGALAHRMYCAQSSESAAARADPGEPAQRPSPK
jgi:hypothetical protein